MRSAPCDPPTLSSDPLVPTVEMLSESRKRKLKRHATRLVKEHGAEVAASILTTLVSSAAALLADRHSRARAASDAAEHAAKKAEKKAKKAAKGKKGKKKHGKGKLARRDRGEATPA